MLTHFFYFFSFPPLQKIEKKNLILSKRHSQPIFSITTNSNVLSPLSSISSDVYYNPQLYPTKFIWEKGGETKGQNEKKKSKKIKQTKKNQFINIFFETVNKMQKKFLLFFFFYLTFFSASQFFFFFLYSSFEPFISETSKIVDAIMFNDFFSFFPLLTFSSFFLNKIFHW